MLVQHQQCFFRFLFQKSIEPPHPGVPILLHIIFAAFAALPRQIPKICDLPRQIISAAKITGLVVGLHFDSKAYGMDILDSNSYYNVFSPNTMSPKTV